VAQAALRAGVELNQRRRDRYVAPSVRCSHWVSQCRQISINQPSVETASSGKCCSSWRNAAAALDTHHQLGYWMLLVIPAKLDNQTAALKLAICDDIGDASYDNQRVATESICSTSYKLQQLICCQKNPLQSRYELDPTPFTGEDYLHALAEQRNQGDVERTARQLLTDFRKGLLGAMLLELPPRKSQLCSLGQVPPNRWDDLNRINFSSFV